MFSKEEAKQLKMEFWTSFGLYMKKHTLHYNCKINWVNYKTKIKDIYFRLNATNKTVSFSIELQHKDEGIRLLFYDQFTELKTALQAQFKTPLIWDKKTTNLFGIEISKIHCEQNNVNVFDKNTWKTAFVFLEECSLAIHTFWEDFKPVFTPLT